MTKLNKIGAALAFGVVAAVSAPVSAISFVAGDIKFTVDFYDAGAVGYAAGAPTCASVLACDAAVGTASPGGIGSEDTWGIFSIAGISRISDNSIIYSKVSGGSEFYTGMFYGLTDELVYRGGIPDNTSAWANGGSLKVWQNTSDYNPDPNSTANGVDGRIGLDGFQGISDQGGTMVLEAMFAGSAEATFPGYSYYSSFNSTNFAGQGQGFLDVVSGEWASFLDTDALIDVDGNSRDLFVDVTFNDVNAAASSIGWTVTAAGQVKGNAIPTPAPLALLGLGLVGFAIRRRKSV